MLYFAYGANLNKESMAYRCPQAAPIGKAFLKDHQLIFRGVADVVRVPGQKVIGALWAITDECEASLDRFEGFPRIYTKKRVKVVCPTLGEKPVEAMVYVMVGNRRQDGPSDSYLRTILGGYRDFGISRKWGELLVSAARAAFFREEEG